MTAEFEQLATFAETLYRGNFSRTGYGEFAVAADGGTTIRFAALPGNPAMVVARVRILSMDDVRRSADFAKAALAGNFFWGGTRGATLSVGDDGGLYITERRFAGELAEEEGLESCIDDFTETADDWRERSRLYA
jgi:hypothetical protein